MSIAVSPTEWGDVCATSWDVRSTTSSPRSWQGRMRLRTQTCCVRASPCRGIWSSSCAQMDGWAGTSHPRRGSWLMTASSWEWLSCRWICSRRWTAPTRDWRPHWMPFVPTSPIPGGSVRSRRSPGFRRRNWRGSVGARSGCRPGACCSACGWSTPCGCCRPRPLPPGRSPQRAASTTRVPSRDSSGRSWGSRRAPTASRGCRRREPESPRVPIPQFTRAGCG